CSSLDVGNIRLVNPSARRDLGLRKALRSSCLGQLTPEAEMGLQRLQFGDRVGTLGASLVLNLAHEIAELGGHFAPPSDPCYGVYAITSSRPRPGHLRGGWRPLFSRALHRPRSIRAAWISFCWCV